MHLTELHKTWKCSMLRLSIQCHDVHLAEGHMTQGYSMLAMKNGCRQGPNLPLGGCELLGVEEVQRAPYHAKVPTLLVYHLGKPMLFSKLRNIVASQAGAGDPPK